MLLAMSGFYFLVEVVLEDQLGYALRVEGIYLLAPSVEDFLDEWVRANVSSWPSEMDRARVWDRGRSDSDFALALSGSRAK
jgi:hypothetical protein